MRPACGDPPTPPPPHPHPPTHPCPRAAGAFGVLAQLFWDRALGLPLERPKSVTSEWLDNFIKNNPDGLK